MQAAANARAGTSTRNTAIPEPCRPALHFPRANEPHLRCLLQYRLHAAVPTAVPLRHHVLRHRTDAVPLSRAAIQPAAASPRAEQTPQLRPQTLRRIHTCAAAAAKVPPCLDALRRVMQVAGHAAARLLQGQAARMGGSQSQLNWHPVHIKPPQRRRVVAEQPCKHTNDAPAAPRPGPPPRPSGC